LIEVAPKQPTPKGRYPVIDSQKKRFIICTYQNSGLLVNHLRPSRVGEHSQAEADQKLAPAKDAKHLEKNAKRSRGQEKRDNQKRTLSVQNKKLLLQKTKKFNLNTTIRQTLTTHPIWVGAIVAFGLIMATAISPAKAQAADRSWGNIDLAKKAIETVSPIVSDQKTDSTSASLVFASDEFIQKPLVIQTEVTKEEPPKKPVAKKISAVKKVDQVGPNHNFPYGYCTYYVSTRRPIYWSGNAIYWLANARLAGFATGDLPQAGAIMVTTEGGWTGHVAMVDAVNGDQVTISEMNYRGWGVISSRTIPASYGAILGYIY